MRQTNWNTHFFDIWHYFLTITSHCTEVSWHLIDYCMLLLTLLNSWELLCFMVFSTWPTLRLICSRSLLNTYYCKVLVCQYCRVWIQFWWCIWFYQPTKWWALWKVRVWNHDNHHRWYRFLVQHNNDSQSLWSECTAETLWKYVMHIEVVPWLKDYHTILNMF